MPDTKQFRNALATIKSQSWVNMGATRNPMFKQALRHVAGAHDFSSDAVTITGINKKIETVKIRTTIHLSKEDRSYITLAFVFENNEKLCRIDRRYYDAKLKAHFLPDELREIKGDEPNVFISSVFAYAAQFAASMASGGHSSNVLSPSTSNGINAIATAAGTAATLDPKQDRELQEMFAKRITEIAEKIGFDATKTFVIAQKAGGAKPVVFVSLKRVGDDAYVKDSRAFRVDGTTVTEYNPDILQSRGLVRSKLGVFRSRKLESELKGIFDAFVEKHGNAEATAAASSRFSAVLKMFFDKKLRPKGSHTLMSSDKIRNAIVRHYGKLFGLDSTGSNIRSVKLAIVGAHTAKLSVRVENDSTATTYNFELEFDADSVVTAVKELSETKAHASIRAPRVAIAGDELSDRVASIVYGDLKRIKSTIAAWDKQVKKGNMSKDEYKEFVDYQTSVAKFIAKTMIPNMSEAYQAKCKAI